MIQVTQVNRFGAMTISYPRHMEEEAEARYFAFMQDPSTTFVQFCVDFVVQRHFVTPTLVSEGAAN